MNELSGPRIATPNAGKLATQPMAVLLASAAARRATGTFLFDHQDHHNELTMREGLITGVQTSTPVAYLGGILYEQAVIGSGVLNETLHEVARGRRLHGAILEERGLVTREQLDAALVEQTLRRVYHLFSLPEQTSWRFDQGLDHTTTARDADRPAIDPWHAIWRGLRECKPTHDVTRTVRELERGLRLRDDVAALHQLGLNDEERGVCERLSQPMTVAAFIASSPFGKDRTALLLYFLALARSVVRVQIGVVSPRELGPEGVRQRARKIASEDPYTVLGLPADASPEAARAAWFRLARLWHADNIPEDLQGVRAECDVVFGHLQRAQRALTEDGAGAENAIARARAAAPAVTMADIQAALARRDLGTAATLATALSSAGVEGPRARAVVVWCQVRAGAAPVHMLEAGLVALQQILAGDPECADALFYRGQILERLGQTASASRDFRKIARLDERHVGGQREVGLHAMPVRDAASGSMRQRPMSSAELHGTGTTGPVASGLRRLLRSVAGK